MELFTAYYDATRDEIKGCKKGSLVYLHEYRHKIQFNSNFGKIFQFIEMYIFRVFCGIGVFLAFVDFKNRIYWFASCGILMIPSVLIIQIFEIDAWIYAFRKRFQKM